MYRFHFRGFEFDSHLDFYLNENLKLIKKNEEKNYEDDCWNMCKIFIYCYQVMQRKKLLPCWLLKN